MTRRVSGSRLTVVTFRLDDEDRAKLDGLVEAHRRRSAALGLAGEATATSVLRALIRSAYVGAPGAAKKRRPAAVASGS